MYICIYIYIERERDRYVAHGLGLPHHELVDVKCYVEVVGDVPVEARAREGVQHDTLRHLVYLRVRSVGVVLNLLHHLHHLLLIGWSGLVEVGGAIEDRAQLRHDKVEVSNPLSLHLAHLEGNKSNNHNNK